MVKTCSRVLQRLLRGRVKPSGNLLLSNPHSHRSFRAPLTLSHAFTCYSVQLGVFDQRLVADKEIG